MSVSRGVTNNDVVLGLVAAGTPDASSFVGMLQRFKLLPNPQTVQANAARLCAANPGVAPAALAQRHGSTTVKRLTTIGGVAALPSTVPGLGTAAQLAITGTTLSSEMLYTLRRLTQTQMEIAALHGLPVQDPDAADELHPDRLEDILIVWALGTGLVMPASEAGKRVGTKVAIAQFNRHVSGEVLGRINRKVGTTVLTKWGTKRGGIALGRLIPFGVGAAVGAGTNYVFARSLVRQMVRFHGDLRPQNAELFVSA